MMYDEYKKKFLKEISSISYKYNVRDIFSDFCNVFAISLQNAVWFSEEKEQEYNKTMSRYSKEEQEKLINLGCYVIQGLESKMGDFLGECFEQLAMNDKKYKGQCFTPYHIGLLMADMTYSKEYIEELYKDKEITSLQDCCCGGGCLLISACDVLKQRNLNYQEKVYIWANDIDSLCVRMCYIQLSLIGAMAKVTCGDALKMEYTEQWLTPMYVMNYNKIVNNFTEREENTQNEVKINKILPSGNKEQLNLFKRAEI